MPFRVAGEQKVFPEEEEGAFAPEPEVAPGRSTGTFVYLLVCHFIVALWVRYTVDLWGGLPLAAAK